MHNIKREKKENERNAQDEYQKKSIEKRHQFVLIPEGLEGEEMQQEKKV